MRASIYSSFREAIESYSPLLEHGFYYKHLSWWFKYFPQKNFKIVLYKDIKQDPMNSVQELFEFLDVDKSFEPESVYRKVNVTNELKKKKDRIPLVRPFLIHARNFLRSTPLNKPVEAINNRFSFQGKIKRLLWKNTVETRDPVPIRPFIGKEEKEMLKDIYKEDVEKLEKLLDRDLSFWLEGN